MNLMKIYSEHYNFLKDLTNLFLRSAFSVLKVCRRFYLYKRYILCLKEILVTVIKSDKCSKEFID